MPDFSASADYRTQLNGVLSQLQAEGQDPALAKAAFDDALGGMMEKAQSLSPDLYQAAAKYTLAAHSALGAADTITGLVSAATSASNQAPGEAMKSVMGVLVGAGMAAGIVTGGVGAAVIGGVAIAAALLNDLFGGADGPKVQLCGTTVTNPLPCQSGVCMLSDVCQEASGKRVPDPQSNAWRLFPVPGDATDAIWYQGPPPSQPGGLVVGSGGAHAPIYFAWRGAQWNNVAGMYGTMPLEGMFGPDVWKVLALESPSVGRIFGADAFTSFVQGLPDDFRKALTVAYKKNKEYPLNGLRSPAEDWQVFMQTVRTWNFAHDPGSPIAIGSDAPGPFGAWVETVSRYRSDVAPNGQMTLHTGMRKDAQSTLGPGPRSIGRSLHSALGPLLPSSSTTKSASSKTLLGAGAGAAAVLFFVGLGPYVLLGAAAGAVIGHALGAPKPPAPPAPPPLKAPVATLTSSPGSTLFAIRK